MAAELAATELVIFVDACAADEPGAIRVFPVAAREGSPETASAGSAALLATGSRCAGTHRRGRFALTIGAGHFGYGEEISGRCARRCRARCGC